MSNKAQKPPASAALLSGVTWAWRRHYCTVSVFLSLHLLQSRGAWTFMYVCRTHAFLQLLQLGTADPDISFLPKQSNHRETDIFWPPFTSLLPVFLSFFLPFAHFSVHMCIPTCLHFPSDHALLFTEHPWFKHSQWMLCKIQSEEKEQEKGMIHQDEANNTWKATKILFISFLNITKGILNQVRKQLKGLNPELQRIQMEEPSALTLNSNIFTLWDQYDSILGCNSPESAHTQLYELHWTVISTVFVDFSLCQRP